MVMSQWAVGMTGNEFPSCERVLFFCKGGGGYFVYPDLCSKSECSESLAN